MRTDQGFTLIETLVAIVLLSVLVTVVTAPITGLFGMTRDSASRVDATSQAQQAIEYIKSEWGTATKYDATCIANTLNITDYGIVTVQSLNYNSVEVGPVAFRSTCIGATSNSSVPIKRVTVVSKVQNIEAKLTVDLARPQ